MGLYPRPGTAELYVYAYPNARDGRVIADVVRLDKGHTEGLEPKMTEVLIKMMVGALGGKAQKWRDLAEAWNGRIRDRSRLETVFFPPANEPGRVLGLVTGSQASFAVELGIHGSFNGAGYSVQQTLA